MSHGAQKLDLECALYVVATPIGNLRDISLRALDVLASADVVAAEDTRNTAHLLAHYGISTARPLAVHQHNEKHASEKVVALLAAGKSVAFASDAGTPAVSDPGALLVEAVRAAGHRVIPVPGASAAIAALSAAGFNAPHFLFYGFLPNKSGARCSALQALKALPVTLVFYEAPHRIVECIADMASVFEPDRDIVFAREITKLFESIHRCPLADALDWLNSDANNQRGEFVLLLEGAKERAGLDDQALHTLEVLLRELPVKQAVKMAAEITGAARNDMYKRALEMKAQE